MTILLPQPLADETEELMRFLNASERRGPGQYEVIETRLDYLKTLTEEIERELEGDTAALRELQEAFRRETDVVFLQSPLLRRMRLWPAGYPGDYDTLEMVYANQPQAPGGLALHLDCYILTRTLAVAVRSRLRKLAAILAERAQRETGQANWLNLACGPCRELLAVPPDPERTIWCIDADENALRYAQQLLAREGRVGDRVEFVKSNAMRLIDAARNVREYGRLTTIYSTGFFDYVADERLVKLISGLYRSLAPEGELIASFKDRRRYATFDYHWIGKWHYFLQRSAEDVADVLSAAGIPQARLTIERDDSGVILFVRASA